MEIPEHLYVISQELRVPLSFGERRGVELSISKYKRNGSYFVWDDFVELPGLETDDPETIRMKAEIMGMTPVVFDRLGRRNSYDWKVIGRILEASEAKLEAGN